MAEDADAEREGARPTFLALYSSLVCRRGGRLLSILPKARASIMGGAERKKNSDLSETLFPSLRKTGVEKKFRQNLSALLLQRLLEI